MGSLTKLNQEDQQSRDEEFKNAASAMSQKVLPGIKQLTKSVAEIAEVERLMVEQVLADKAVATTVMDLDQALTTGATALFGEKYGDQVRVVQVPGFSKELCGGTHVGRTGEIGVCKITSEGSISAGVRRIEAVTGEGALARFEEAEGSLRRVAELMRVSETEVVEQVEKALEQRRALERQIEQLKAKVAQAQMSGLEHQARTVQGVRVVAERVDGLDRQQMRALADSLRNKWKSAVIVLASADDAGVAIVSAVTKDLTAKVHAGKLAGAVAQAVGGKGGGRPDMAQGGAALPAEATLTDVVQRWTEKLRTLVEA